MGRKLVTVSAVFSWKKKQCVSPTIFLSSHILESFTFLRIIRELLRTVLWYYLEFIARGKLADGWPNYSGTNCRSVSANASPWTRHGRAGKMADDGPEHCLENGGHILQDRQENINCLQNDQKRKVAYIYNNELLNHCDELPKVPRRVCIEWMPANFNLFTKSTWEHTADTASAQEDQYVNELICC